jgi:hypothetical protein
MKASFLTLTAAAVASATIMNQGGVPYEISNPAPTGKYSTDFEKNAGGKVDFFDVYGEVQTKYSQVYWTRNAPINLPKELVERFKGKTMAITGYEVDQVTHTGPETGSTTHGDILGGFSCYPSCEETDKSVPIYHAYNHHYFSWLTGTNSEYYKRDVPDKVPNPTYTGFRTKEGAPKDLPPSNIVFKENPGGEFRKSYHGYPAGFAQLIYEPNQWVVEPMQIDTHNRNYDITDTEGYKPWFLPKRDTVNATMTNLNSGLSPLIECPCSDRITRSVVNTSQILMSDSTCKSSITSVEGCMLAARATGATLSSSSPKIVNDESLAFGCILSPSNITNNEYLATFNTMRTSVATCGNSSSSMLGGEANLGNLTNLEITHDGTTATIIISGPENYWFGVGFDATAMKNSPYAIIVDGNGKVQERRLVNHGPGTLLNASFNLTSSSVTSGKRTVVLKRPVRGMTKQHFTLPTLPGKINIITAIGNTAQLAYHKSRTGSSITLLPTKVSSCLCAPTQSTYLTYMDTDTQEFSYDCLDAPRSDMKSHGDGTGRNVENKACKMQTYGGGLRCCQHKYFLTDRDQDDQIPMDKVDKYFLKWRYYFQEYVPATGTKAASHKHLHHWVFLIDANVNDYEEDNANYGEKSIGRITANLTVATMGIEDTPANYKTLSPLVMTPHCHAPSCIREELWNTDTNPPTIICNVTVNYGDKSNGKTSGIFNEENYVAIPPCIWGKQDGLMEPLKLKPETNIMAVKYFNNTFRHYGQMAQWTGLLIYDEGDEVIEVLEVDGLHPCSSDADCKNLCTYCQNGVGKTPPYNCHAPADGCCLDDSDCDGSYCMNGPGHAQPWKCHGKGRKFLKVLRDHNEKTESDIHQCTTNEDCAPYCSFCMNDPSKTPPFVCHAPLKGCCTDDDCPGSYCMNGPGKTKPFHCHGSFLKS